MNINDGWIFYIECRKEEKAKEFQSEKIILCPECDDDGRMENTARWSNEK